MMTQMGVGPGQMVTNVNIRQPSQPANTSYVCRHGRVKNISNFNPSNNVQQQPMQQQPQPQFPMQQQQFRPQQQLQPQSQQFQPQQQQQFQPQLQQQFQSQQQQFPIQQQQQQQFPIIQTPLPVNMTPTPMMTPTPSMTPLPTLHPMRSVLQPRQPIVIQQQPQMRPIMTYQQQPPRYVVVQNGGIIQSQQMYR